MYISYVSLIGDTFPFVYTLCLNILYSEYLFLFLSMFFSIASLAFFKLVLSAIMLGGSQPFAPGSINAIELYTYFFFDILSMVSSFISILPFYLPGIGPGLFV